ncbi:unnamed protein product [Paramecium octaurelia]|uniref:Uncharacterized protein n=1 Tax=Paramecium octaurelia TaxID=43137 RepID=A0A8S1YNW6_PAROT|nr:unnamed protein product [Paramecium octaurelia]
MLKQCHLTLKMIWRSNRKVNLFLFRFHSSSLVQNTQKYKNQRKYGCTSKFEQALKIKLMLLDQNIKLIHYQNYKENQKLNFILLHWKWVWLRMFILKANYKSYEALSYSVTLHLKGYNFSDSYLRVILILELLCKPNLIIPDQQLDLNVVLFRKISGLLYFIYQQRQKLKMIRENLSHSKERYLESFNCFLKWQDFENSLFFIIQVLFILESNSQVEILQENLIKLRNPKPIKRQRNQKQMFKFQGYASKTQTEFSSWDATNIYINQAQLIILNCQNADLLKIF